MTADFPRTAGQTAAQILREHILSGEIEAGAPLNQNDLAQALGMSRIPIRDALRLLAAEGLVHMRAHASATVAPLGIEDLEELYEIRLAIEPRLCRLAVPSLTEEDLDEMASVLEQMDDEEDTDTFVELNSRFHGIMYDRSNRPRSIEITRMARQHTARYVRIYAGFELESVGVEHRLIYEAARAGHARRVEALVAAHLSAGYETMLRYVAQQQAQPSRDNGASAET